MRPRELWFWLGAAFLTIGGVLTAVAIAYFTKEKHYSLSTGPHMLMAYASYVLAFLCFLAAIAGWRPWLRWQRFPNLTIRVDGVGNERANAQVFPDYPPRPTLLHTLIIHIINTEADRRVSIRAMYLLARAKPDWSTYYQLFSRPYSPISRTGSSPTGALEFPVNLAPGESDGGELIFELEDYRMANVAEPFDALIEIHDAISEEMATFPANMGIYRRRRGLRAATYAERVNGPRAAQPWYSLMGPRDPDRQM